MKKGLNLQNIKQSNRASVLYLLLEQGPTSRNSISKKLGLTKAALTKICHQLIDQGLIVETESVGSGVGRKEVLLELKFDDSKAFGITFEKDEITFSIAGLDGKVNEVESIDFNDSFDYVNERIKNYYERVKNIYHIVGCGVSIIGLENNYGVYKDVNIKKELEEYIIEPIFIKNNVQAFSQAQVMFGDLAYEKNLLVFKWGPGIGSSFIREGKVISGDDSGIAEIGHMIVNPNGKPCRCGRCGCLETETSLDIIKNDINKLGYDLSIDEILASTDKKIIDILDEKISMVCLALLNASTILNANQIVLFGSVFKIESFTKLFLSKWNKLTNSLSQKTIVVSNLNDKSSYIGSIAMVSRKLFFEKV